MTTSAPQLVPIALAPEEGEALWAFGFLATMKASSETTAGRVAVIEHLAPRGAGSPLHVHHREDEWFYVLDGELTFWVGGEVVNAPAGSFVYGPRDVPHTFVVRLSRRASCSSPSPPGSRVLPSGGRARGDVWRFRPRRRSRPTSRAHRARRRIRHRDPRPARHPQPDDPSLFSRERRSLWRCQRANWKVSTAFVRLTSLRSTPVTGTPGRRCSTANAVQMPPNAPANVGAENIRGWSGGMLAAFGVEFALSPEESPTGRPGMGLRTGHVHDHAHPKVR